MVRIISTSAVDTSEFYDPGLDGLSFDTKDPPKKSRAASKPAKTSAEKRPKPTPKKKVVIGKSLL